MDIIIRQASVIGEAVIAVQLLLKKKIITRDEILEIRKTLIHTDSILSPGSSLQSEDTGSDVDSSGSREPRVSGVSGHRGNQDSPATPNNSSDVSRESEQGDTDSVAGKSQITSTMIGDVELVEPTEEGRRQY